MLNCRRGQAPCQQYQFFHWQLAFPAVFLMPTADHKPDNEQVGWSGGFDCVLGNPPWERVKLSEDEWFAATRPDISGASNSEHRSTLIERLEAEDPVLFARFVAAKRHADSVSGFIRNSALYPLCGVGDINTYSIFAELNRNLLHKSGRVGCVLQAGIATDKTTSEFFEDIVTSKSLVSLFSFDNHDGIFPSVKRSTRFCLLTLTGPARSFEQGIKFTFYARSLEQIYDPDRCVVLTPTDIALLNPNTKTCPVFQSKADSDLVSAIYRRIPVLVNEETHTNSWQLSIRRILDMNKREVLNSCTTTPTAERESDLPVYEAKLFDQLNHRGATYQNGRVRDFSAEDLQNPSSSINSRYWIARSKLIQRLPDFWDARWLLVWQDVTDVNTMARTVSSAVLPISGSDFTVRVGFLQGDRAKHALVLACTFNTFVFDYVSRQKIGGTHLSDYVLKQLPVLPPSLFSGQCAWATEMPSIGEWVSGRVLELTYTAWNLQPFAQECGDSAPPFRWDEERRFFLRCELDAAYFHLYLPAEANGEWRMVGNETAEGIARLKASFTNPRDAVVHVMDAFPIVRRKDEDLWNEYRTKRVVLENLRCVGRSDAHRRAVSDAPRSTSC